jgi:putative transposase
VPWPGVSLRDQRCGCDHLQVWLSLSYRLLRCLLGLLMVLLGSDLSKEVELLVLRHDNRVLRRQVRGRPRWDHLDRLWLAALSRLVQRSRWGAGLPDYCGHDPGAGTATWSPGWTYTDLHRPVPTYTDRCRPTPTGAGRDGRLWGLDQEADSSDGAGEAGWGIGASRVNWPGSAA